MSETKAPDRGTKCTCPLCLGPEAFGKFVMEELERAGCKVEAATVISMGRPDMAADAAGKPSDAPQAAKHPRTLMTSLQAKLTANARRLRSEAKELESLASTLPGLSDNAVSGVELLYGGFGVGSVVGGASL